MGYVAILLVAPIPAGATDGNRMDQCRASGGACTGHVIACKVWTSGMSTVEVGGESRQYPVATCKTAADPAIVFS